MLRPIHFAACRQVVAGLFILAMGVQPAHAIWTTATDTGTKLLTLQVGDPTAGTINNVDFSLPGAQVGNSVAITGASNQGTLAPQQPAGTLLVKMVTHAPSGGGANNGTATLTMNVPSALTCVAGGCGAGTISFNQISWTVSEPTLPDATNYPGWSTAVNISAGTFSAGAGAQSLLSFTTRHSIQGFLTFKYANTVSGLASGTYAGTVTYTATIP